MTDSAGGSLADLGVLVGHWTIEATHRLFPDLVVTGDATFDWLEGERFLIARSRVDHPDFPDAISLIGDTDGLRMYYFDSRGVHRTYEVRIGEGWWGYTRNDRPAPGEQPVPGSWQRFIGRLEDGANTIAGVAQLSSDGQTWEDDLWITYRRTEDDHRTTPARR